jgi:hypothetical protein
MDKQVSKKRKFANQISNGIMETLPQITHKIKAKEGNLCMECPSRDGYSNHDVNISVLDNDLKFECDCTGGFSEFKSGFCIHIRSIILKMCNDYINQACEFTDKKDNYIKLKSDIDKISLGISKYTI